MNKSTLLLAGFATDLDLLSSRVPKDAVYSRVDENTSETANLPIAEIVVYVFSPDTGYSSQLLSWFTWIHHHVAPREEYVFALDDVDLTRTVFDFAKNFPVATIEDLERWLDPTAGGDH